MWPLAQRWPNFACSGGDLRPSPCFWTPRWRTKRCARIYCNQYLTNMQWWCKNDDHMNFQDIFQDCMILAWYLYDTCMILVWYLYDTCMILVWLYPQSMPCFFSETLDQELDLEQSREAPWGAEKWCSFLLEQVEHLAMLQDELRAHFWWLRYIWYQYCCLYHHSW